MCRYLEGITLYEGKACICTEKSSYAGNTDIHTPCTCLYVNYIGSGYGSVQFEGNLPPKYGSDYGSASNFDGITEILEHQK